MKSIDVCSKCGKQTDELVKYRLGKLCRDCNQDLQTTLSRAASKWWSKEK